ncbi:craniofacial development protein 2-like [Diadema setosum]|uniref:craniofacial development protein 2-like n=1 Tax=Diadema setosum TaxID=31175 RepID=UPI003B3BA4EB
MPDRSGPGLTTTARPADSLQGGRDKLTTGAKNTIKLPTKGITVRTWNVRTLHACGKIHELTHELDRYRWDIVGLCEVRWTGFGETCTDERHKIWFSEDGRKHQHGVAFIARKEISGSVISCTPIWSRLISIRISARPHKLTIIQAYAPTSGHDNEEVEEFYDQLEATIAKYNEKPRKRQRIDCRKHQGSSQHS